MKLLIALLLFTTIVPVEVPHTVTLVDTTAVELAWVPVDTATYVNIWRNDGNLSYVGDLTAGITNTLTLPGTYQQFFIVSEYRLKTPVELEMIRLWSSTEIPTSTIVLTDETRLYLPLVWQ